MTATTTVETASVHVSSGSRRARRRTSTVVALVPLVVLLAACGSGGGSGGGSGVAKSAGPSSSPSRPFGQNGGASLPGASGLIAAASPGTLQVQGTDAQTTVTYTKATRFTQTVTARLAAGECVTVTGTPVTGASDSLTAASVRIDAKVDGACPTANGRGPGGFGGSGGPGAAGQSGSGRASTASPRPSGAPSGPQGLRNFAFATGMVDSVSGSTVTVRGVLRDGRSIAGSGSSAAATPTAPAPTTITITLAAATTVTQTVATTSAAAVVGRCATALGRADDRGDIAATAITISTPDASGCRGGFGGFGGRGGFGGDGTGGQGGSGSGSGTNA